MPGTPAQSRGRGQVPTNEEVLDPETDRVLRDRSCVLHGEVVTTPECDVSVTQQSLSKQAKWILDDLPEMKVGEEQEVIGHAALADYLEPAPHSSPHPCSLSASPW